MILAAGIDDLFFKFIEKPEAWGFLGFLFMLAVAFAYLILRFAHTIIIKDQDQIGALLKLSTKTVVDVKDEMRDMSNGFKESLEAMSKAFQTAIDNNTRAFQTYASKTDAMDTKVDDALTKIQEGLLELSQNLNTLTEDHRRSKTEMKEILENGIRVLESLCRELNHGTSDGTDINSTGSCSGSNGH